MPRFLLLVILVVLVLPCAYADQLADDLNALGITGKEQHKFIREYLKLESAEAGMCTGVDLRFIEVAPHQWKVTCMDTGTCYAYWAHELFPQPIITYIDQHAIHRLENGQRHMLVDELLYRLGECES